MDENRNAKKHKRKDWLPDQNIQHKLCYVGTSNGKSEASTGSSTDAKKGSHEREKAGRVHSSTERSLSLGLPACLTSGRSMPGIRDTADITDEVLYSPGTYGLCWEDFEYLGTTDKTVSAGLTLLDATEKFVSSNSSF